MKTPEELALESIDSAVRESCEAAIDRAYVEASFRENASRTGLEVIDWSLDGKLLRIRCRLPPYPALIETPLEFTVTADE